MTQATQLEVGSIVAFSTGEYSDYSVGPFVRILKTFNKEVWDQAVKESSESGHYISNYFNPYKAIQFLIQNGFIEEINYTEFHMANYGEAYDWSEA